jgi:hypothetical protein
MLINNDLTENELNNKKIEGDIIIVTNNSTSTALYTIFHYICSLIAVYLNWRCNNGKSDLLSLIIAVCCPYLYILYILMNFGTCGVFEKCSIIEQKI